MKLRQRSGALLLWMICASFICFKSAYAQTDSQTETNDSVEIELWHGTPPFAQTETPQTVVPSGDGVIKLSNVYHPSITVYPIKQSKAPHPAILICPGGGYQLLAMNLEGTEIGAWFKEAGVIPVVLKYRVSDKRQREGAFADVQRAMSILRFNAAKWNIDPDKIGIIGFSAGGHLAARMATHFSHRTYDPVDENDTVPTRPDFAILIYPAYLVNEDGNISNQVEVSDHTPPTFLVQTEDDAIGYTNSVDFFNALAIQHIPTELHMFAQGGHGYGLRTSKDKPLSEWPVLCERWLKSIQILPASPSGSGIH
jgi:acetyl esterase/lipase